MGLCKCPKRRVTNQFCFEHRVNVCEWCMVANHPKCIVQSYLQWLQDSDYNPICEICTKVLGDEECIRLTCYHVYHWWCVENRFRSLPSTTAPAGYTCPSCREPLFPAPNLVSPVADVLREKLAGVNWARAGLGLPLLSEDMDMKVTPPSGHRATPVGASDDDDSPPRLPHGTGPPYSVVQMQDDTNTTYANRNDVYPAGNQAPRRIFDNKLPTRTPNSQFDHDDDKYKRKSALEWIIRWWKNTLPPARNRRSLSYMNRRSLMAIILVGIIIVTLLVTMGRVGRSGIENDPAFDPLHNPHINVQREINS